MHSAMPVCRSACAFLLCSCAAQPVDPPVVTETTSVAAHDGKLVTIRGKLRSIKWSMVLGVCVHKEPPSMDGALVEATGVLSGRYAPAPDNVWDSETRPYGVFFVLQDQQVPTRLARVRLVRPNEP